MIKTQAWKCGKCLSLYKTVHEAQRCEVRCLDEKRGRRVYHIFYELYEDFKEEKGSAGYKFFAGCLLNKLNHAEAILEESYKKSKGEKE